VDTRATLDDARRERTAHQAPQARVVGRVGHQQALDDGLREVGAHRVEDREVLRDA
jgi:hypothetical protein